MIESCCPLTKFTKIEDEFSDFSHLICLLLFSIVPNHKIMPPLDLSSRKTYKKRYYMIFQTWWFPSKADFIRECQNSRWPPKSKIAAKYFAFSRLEFLVWPISTTMQKIRLVPQCVTDADLSCRTIISQNWHHAISIISPAGSQVYIFDIFNFANGSFNKHQTQSIDILWSGSNVIMKKCDYFSLEMHH